MLNDKKKKFLFNNLFDDYKMYVVKNKQIGVFEGFLFSESQIKIWFCSFEKRNQLNRYGNSLFLNFFNFSNGTKKGASQLRAAL